MTIDKFNPTIWSGRILANYHERAVYPMLCNRDYEGDIRDKGDSVKIHSIGAITVSPYTKNSDLSAPQVLDDSELTLQITEADSFHFYVDDVDKRQQDPKLMGEATREAAQAMRLSADTFVGALMAAAIDAENQLGTFTVGAFDTPAYDLLVDLGVALDDALCPEENRWVVVPNWYVGELVKDERFSSFGTPENVGNLKNGLAGIMKTTGMRVHRNVPSRIPTSGTGKVIIAGHGVATSYADQINKTEAYRPERRFGDAMKGLHLYGGKVIRPYCLASAVVEQAA